MMALIGDAKQTDKNGPVETGLTELVAMPCNAITISLQNLGV